MIVLRYFLQVATREQEVVGDWEHDEAEHEIPLMVMHRKVVMVEEKRWEQEDGVRGFLRLKRLVHPGRIMRQLMKS